MIISIDEFYKKINNELKQNIENLIFSPAVSLIRIGNNPGAISYEKSIVKEAKNLGVICKTKVFDTNTSQEEIIRYIHIQNQDKDIHGILIFTPIEGEYDRIEILNSIEKSKDVDGLSNKNYAEILQKKSYRNIATTAVAIRDYLNYITNLKSKDILIINRSLIIGKPLSFMLLNDDATVTVAHSKTKLLEDKMKNYDIVISAVGKAEIFSNIDLKENVIVIDAGYSFKDGKYFGDFVKDEFKDNKVKYLPAVGGIGRINSNIILRNVYLNGVENVR